MFGKLFCAFSIALMTPAIAQDRSALLDAINLPPGFKISIFAEVTAPRQIEYDAASGIIFIGSRHGHIVSLQDKNKDGISDEKTMLANGLNVPNGVAVKNSTLYVGLQDRIALWSEKIDPNSKRPIQALKTINADLHDNGWHGWRFINFGPDNKLYVTLGAPCNICELTANTGKIIRMDEDGTNWQVVADGVRNSVGFDWHPITGELWFTDNGADRMGDDTPPDELNRVTKAGQHFGFPYLGGKTTKLAGYENKNPPMKITPAEIEFQAHTANLGIEFYNGDMFPAEYKNDAFVAQHGSWNRSTPVGYRIMRVRFDAAGNANGKEVFADGWLVDGEPIGRPVDLEELPDGSLLVSDNHANVIYRISYEN
ncbi:MAG: PQQ-dependent sugar dehydrogenase [Rhizobiaceae bacterium]|nr:PQQ-dependent sugar dehydrogenase [Rhizobiaceae bacterium]